MSRKDTKGRILKEGESQRKDGRYQCRYTDRFGKRQYYYSWKLFRTDPLRQGVKNDLDNAAANNAEPFLLPHFTAHNIRHTFVTRLADRKNDVNVIKYLAGHSDITTTLEIDDEASADRVNAEFESIDMED